MKQFKIICILFTLLSFSFTGFLASAQGAGSISGTVSYDGSPEGPIYVVLFTSPTSCSPPNPDDYAIIELQVLGIYSFPDLPDGTYYVASAILNCGTDCDLQPTDPWGVYGGCDTSTPVVLSGGNAESGIDITLVDGTAGIPNPFYDPYDTDATSMHANGQYRVWLDVEDEAHSLTSVRVTGPGLAGWIDLLFNQDNWVLENWISFGSTHPAPPLTYYFEIIDSEGTHFRTEVVESFVDVFATDLSPANGEPIAGTPVLSWTGVGDGYTYGPGVNGNGIYWDIDDLTSTSVVYDGPPLTVGKTYNWYVDVRDVYDNLSQTGSSFVYVQPTTLSVIKDGSGSGTVTSSPGGIDCGGACSHDFPEGSTVILSAAPDTGSAFAGWSGGGCGGINYCVPELSSAATVTATFVPSGGSISGTVSYSGSPEGPIYVVLFTSPTSCSPPNPDDYAVIELPALGSYSFPDLPDGTYYVASAILNCGTDCDLQPTDPWGVYGGCDTSTQVVLSGGNAESGIDITMVDGTVEDPNPFYDSYEANAESGHENDAYWVWLNVDDQAHNATSVSVTGPGISGSMDLVFDVDEWKLADSISFGSTHPAPPLTYTFTIIDSEGTHIRTEVVESFVDVFATDLSPADGEPVIGTPEFSWTGVGDGYTYEVRVYSNDFYWDVDDLTSTSVEYSGLSLTLGQTYYWCVEVNDAYGNISKTSDESFVYTQEATLTVVKDGSGSGTVTSSPAGIDCGTDCANQYLPGSQVRLSATPDTGSAFAGWSGGGCNGIGDCIPELTSDTTVTATFTIPGTDPITLSVSPASVSADSSTGFTFQTRAASQGGTILFELFHDVNNNGVIDGNEWPIWEQIFTDNKWINDDDFLSGDANPSVLQITIDFDFAGGLLPAGDYVARVTNTISESDTVPLTVIPVSTSQSVGGYIYEQGTTTPIPNALVFAVNPVTESFVSAVISAEDGSFSLLIPVPGDIATGCEKEGYIRDDYSLVRVTVPAGGTANQNFYLIIPDSQITGTVTEYYSGNPVWGIRVDGEVQDDQYGSEVVTDINGNFSLPALAGMSWEVEAEAEDTPGYFGGLSTYIFPTVSGPNRVDFTVHRVSAWIDGTILDEYGSLAVEGVNFYVNRINTSDPALQRLRNDDDTDASGQATLGIEQGDWRVGLYLGRSEDPVLVDGLPKEMVPPGKADVLDLDFGEHRPVTMQAYYADGAVEGTIYEADGVTPAADVDVSAYSNNALNGPEHISVGRIDTGTRTDENGHYRLPLLGGTWTIKVRFSDGTEQVLQTITLTTDGNDLIDQPGETLTGIDLGVPHINVTPTSLDFGSTTIGGTSASQILTISNTGSRNLEVSNIDLAGTDSDMFEVTSGGCQTPPFTLSQSSSCNLSLTFSPTSEGPKSALVTISSNDMDEPSVEVQLTGNGTGKTLTINKDGTGTGRVTSSPAGIDCCDQCVALFPEGTLVYLTAIGDQYSAFVNWTGGGCSGNGICSTTMDEDKSVTATFTFDNIPPALPTGLSGSQVGFQVNLTWAVNPEPDILGYNIYRDGVKINTGLISPNSYSEDVTGGKTYVYNVTAVDWVNNESPFSNAVSISTSILLPVIFYPETGVFYIGIDSEIAVIGTAEPGSTVEVFVNGISQGTTIANSWGHFTFRGVIVNDGEHSITVVSTNSYGETSPISDVVTVSFDMRPSAPQGLSASPGDTTATITWDIVSESDVEGYNIYRDGAQVNNNLLTETTYTDVRLTNGRVYNYTVTAKDTNSSESNKTNTITVTPVAGPEWD